MHAMLHSYSDYVIGSGMSSHLANARDSQRESDMLMPCQGM